MFRIRLAPRRQLGLAVCLSVLTLISSHAAAKSADQPKLTYHLTYSLETPNLVHISIQLPQPATDPQPLTLIMPRSVPGNYAQRPYDPFVSNVKAFSESAPHASKNDVVPVDRDEFGPRWTLGKRTSPPAAITRIEYDVDVAKMERDILFSSDTSKIREGYVGLLGYTVFAFLEDHENLPIQLEIQTPANWPVFSTLAPQVPAATTTFTTKAANYYALADSQITLGPKIQISKRDAATPNSPTLFVSLYAERASDIAVDAALARDALDKVTAYFGSAPFSHYSAVIEYLKPLPPPHVYNFSMEHLESGTFFMDTDYVMTEASPPQYKEGDRFNYAHHIAHSWIPKRCYGAGYLPFNWEMTPVIDTIWFNEGFGRYAAIEAIAQGLPPQEAAAFRAQQLARLRQILDTAPPFLRNMPLDVLSREASFLYASDFRTGMNVFARGALMAAEMDNEIRTKTAGKKSLQDALQALLAWSAQNHRAFQIKEMLNIFHAATNVDVQDILNTWMHPPTN